ncbi:MAG: YqcC family protein [Ginsengibacter sp.]
MRENGKIDDLILQLKAELERLGLWQQAIPSWVNSFDEKHLFQSDFAQWLQFVFVPNRLQAGHKITKGPHLLLVPQAMKFFGTELQKGKLLEILIEIDGLL